MQRNNVVISSVHHVTFDFSPRSKHQLQTLFAVSLSLSFFLICVTRNTNFNRLFSKCMGGPVNLTGKSWYDFTKSLSGKYAQSLLHSAYWPNIIYQGPTLTEQNEISLHGSRSSLSLDFSCLGTEDVTWALEQEAGDKPQPPRFWTDRRRDKMRPTPGYHTSKVTMTCPRRQDTRRITGVPSWAWRGTKRGMGGGGGRRREKFHGPIKYSLWLRTSTTTARGPATSACVRWIKPPSHISILSIPLAFAPFNADAVNAVISSHSFLC